jgi:DNA primase
MSSNNNVEKIKDRLSIVDVISSYITLVPAGKNFKAKCPFHNEKTPSFFISSERNSYYCFGCGAKGDIFSFVEHFEGTDFLGALKLLASRAGVVLENNFLKEDKGEKEKLYEIMEEATVFFESNFGKEQTPRAYLINRGITDESIKIFRVGYALDSWKSVSTYLIGKGFKKQDLEKVGLIKNKDDGSFYDRFRSRIIFPINDSSGRVIAFTGRIFGKESDLEAKYLNSPETVLFNKSNTLFGIDKAKSSIRRLGYSIIVEGQMDLILSHQIGFTNTVAVSGTALSDRTNELSNHDSLIDKENKINNLGLIRRLSSNIIFAYDGDSAGIRAVNRSSLIALALDMQVKVAIMPEGKDPADIIMEDGNKWKEIIKNSVDIINFHLNRIIQNTSDLRQQGKQIKEIIFPFLSVIKSSIEKSTYISLINKKTLIPENAIILDFENYQKSKGQESRPVENGQKMLESKSRRDRLEERLMGIIFWKGEYENSDFKEVRNLCEIFAKEIGEENFEKIKEKHRSNSSVLAFEAEIWYGDKINQIVGDVEEFTLNLEEEILNERLIYLLNEISQKEKNNNEEETSLLLKDYQKIVERIENIKKNRAQ